MNGPMRDLAFARAVRLDMALSALFELGVRLSSGLEAIGGGRRHGRVSLGG